MKIQERLLRFVARANWLILVIVTAVGAWRFSADVVLGIVIGGVIVTINFHLLARTLKRALTPPHLASIKGVLARYYLRFTVTAVVIFILMIKEAVHPVGLVVGLSVVVASMICATLNELRHLMMKEAG